MERVPATEQEVAAIRNRLPKHMMFLCSQDCLCSACRKPLTNTELIWNTEKAIGNTDEANLEFLLCWCVDCQANPIAQQLAIDELRKAVTQGPYIDEIWLTVSPGGTTYIVSEGQIVQEDGSCKDDFFLRPFDQSDYPGGYAAINRLPWQDRYSQWLAAH